MTTPLTAIDVRSARRIRLVFASTVGGTYIDPTLYEVVSVDGAGSEPVPNAAFALSNCPNVVELSLDADLTSGVPYTAGLIGGSQREFLIGEARQSLRADDTAAGDVWAEVYGEDLVWSGEDFAESQTGDLATVGGVPNVEASVVRDITSDGLPWDPAYGGKLRRFVDGPSVSIAEVRGICVKRALADDRVKQASATVLPEDPADPSRSSVEVGFVLIGGQTTTVAAPVRTA